MFTLPTLPYDYDAFEGIISADIMTLHHSKHHQAYVNKLNDAVAKYPELSNRSVEELLRGLNDLPEEIRTTVRNNGGGHYNHSLFWRSMSPNGGGQPEGELHEALVNKYGSFEPFVEEFNAKAISLFGSGWVWLMPDLSITTTPNQDSPLMTGQPEPILGLDVWEHAYYLDYKNRRDEYINNWWKIVDWGEVSVRYGRTQVG